MFDIDNPFMMIVVIVAIAAGARVWRTHLMTRANTDRTREDDQLSASMQSDIDRLTKRVSVLEKLVTDEDRNLASEINRLRDIGQPGAST